MQIDNKEEETEDVLASNGVGFLLLLYSYSICTTFFIWGNLTTKMK